MGRTTRTTRSALSEEAFRLALERVEADGRAARQLVRDHRMTSAHADGRLRPESVLRARGRASAGGALGRPPRHQAPRK